MSQFARQMGATVGVAIFGTFLTHALTAELPKHVPLLPGTSAPSLDLAHAQSQAMKVDVIRLRVTQTLDERFEVVTRAYHDDPAAVAEILGDARIPEQIKASLRDGGIRARVHRTLNDKADLVEKELRDGEDGRDRLLQDSTLSATAKQGLSNIPGRALHDPMLSAQVAEMFRKAIMEREDALVAGTVQSTLAAIRGGMTVYANQLVERIQRGIKVAFATAIANMLSRALWIVALAVLITLFIPEVPLRSRAATPSEAPAPTAESESTA